MPFVLERKNTMQNMTVGSPTKLILMFSLPLLIGNIFQQLYHISDILIVGRLIGVNALAAVGATAPLYFVFSIRRRMSSSVSSWPMSIQQLSLTG